MKARDLSLESSIGNVCLVTTAQSGKRTIEERSKSERDKRSYNRGKKMDEREEREERERKRE